MTVLGVDPGTHDSSVCGYDGRGIQGFGNYANEDLLKVIPNLDVDIVVFERVASYGMAVGEEVFQTVFITGRFVQACEHAEIKWDRMFRKDVKQHLCMSAKANDANIRAALIDKFGGLGGKAAAFGVKKSPGPLYGITGHQMAALALAVTYYDTVVDNGGIKF